MSIENYDASNFAIGDGVITQLPFDFLITNKFDILIVILQVGQLPITVDGTDTTYVSSVTFDPVSGGGIVTLLAPLAVGKTLQLYLDVKSPVQPNLFRDRSNYSLRTYETALDYLVTQIQTVFKGLSGAVRFKRYVDLSLFDPHLPDTLPGQVSVTLVTDPTGVKFIVGPTTDQIANAQGYATAAAGSAATATTQAGIATTQAGIAAAAAASATAAAASAAASATAAAASAAAASGVVMTVVGSRALPAAVVNHMTLPFISTSWFTKMYVQGSGGPVTLDATPSIQAGTMVGQELELIGRDATNTITLGDGNGVDSQGNTILFTIQSSRTFEWDGSVWLLKGSNNV